MSKYLDENGLLYFWQKIKSYVTGLIPTKVSELTNDSGYITSAPGGSSTSPKMDGTATAGTENTWAHGDHVHPTDTSRAALESPTFTGTPKAPTAASGTNTTQLATTAFVQTAVGGVTKASLGLGNVDNTADANKSVASAAALTTERTIDGVSFDGTANIIHYGACSTAAATAAKVVSCPGFTLASGAWIAVRFTVTNSAASPTLNVNSTGAKSIMYRNSALSSSTTKAYLAANRTYLMIYDGTAYQIVGDVDTNTTYSVMTQANLNTGTETTGRLVTCALLRGNFYTQSEADAKYALKTDIAGMYKYKGSVASASLLPSSGQEAGDVYNIEASSTYGGAGMNVAWNGSEWDPLGEIFTVTSVTNAEIDTIVAS